MVQTNYPGLIPGAHMMKVENQLLKVVFSDFYMHMGAHVAPN